MRVCPAGAESVLRANSMLSAWKKPASAAAAAALKELWPDQYSGELPMEEGGVVVPAGMLPEALGLQLPSDGSGVTEPWVPASRIAWNGRQCLKFHFVQTVGATVSAMAMLTRANNRVCSGNKSGCVAVTASATWIHAPGG